MALMISQNPTPQPGTATMGAIGTWEVRQGGWGVGQAVLFVVGDRSAAGGAPHHLPLCHVLLGGAWAHARRYV